MYTVTQTPEPAESVAHKSVTDEDAAWSAIATAQGLTVEQLRDTVEIQDIEVEAL
jgi:hypothetical protein